MLSYPTVQIQGFNGRCHNRSLSTEWLYSRHLSQFWSESKIKAPESGVWSSPSPWLTDGYLWASMLSQSFYKVTNPTTGALPSLPHQFPKATLSNGYAEYSQTLNTLQLSPFLTKCASFPWSFIHLKSKWVLHTDDPVHVMYPYK